MEDSPEIIAAVIISKDGLMMASEIPEEIDNRNIAAVTASMVYVSKRALYEINQGNLTQISIEGESGQIICLNSEKIVLTALINIEAKLDPILSQMKKTLEKVNEALG